MLKDISEYRARLEKLEEGPPPDSKVRDVLIFEAEVRFQASPHLDKELEELFKGLAEEILRDKFSEKMTELKRAEESGDLALAEKLLAECQAISKELHALTKPNK